MAAFFFCLHKKTYISYTILHCPRPLSHVCLLPCEATLSADSFAVLQFRLRLANVQ